ncbi:M67 family metallopeptidase [Sphingomonas sp.]|uniref:M67 family metallopeptidase n=1 Tax=Sphingomonas sp. TaxID=28214 RepID=UPI003CC6A975
MGSAVEFVKGVLDEILAAAAASPGAEICGLLLGTPGHVMQARSCRNVATEPAAAFEIDPTALIAAHRAARSGGPAIAGCYHSHPGGLPQPSLHDAREAEPNGWLWLIVGPGNARLFRAVQHGAMLGRFDPLIILPRTIMP